MIVACKQGHESKSWGKKKQNCIMAYFRKGPWGFHGESSIKCFFFGKDGTEWAVLQTLLSFRQVRRLGGGANGNANRKLKDQSKSAAASKLPLRLQKAAFICIINLKSTRNFPHRHICKNRQKKQPKNTTTNSNNNSSRSEAVTQCQRLQIQFVGFKT